MIEKKNKKKQSRQNLQPALMFLTGDLISIPIPLEREEVLLGRSIEADVRINDAKVSHRHALIKVVSKNSATKYILSDLNSRSGTLLNGEKIKSEELHGGDKITIGEHILRFEFLDEIDREYHQQIHRLLSHDDLTGLMSSRSFFSELRREAANFKKTKRPFCVLMLDVDYFKAVNDTYGHLTGNKALEQIGGCITSNMRIGDVAARFGGEEFAAFLLDAGLAQGIVAAERIRSKIERTKFTVIGKKKSKKTHRITVSIGVAAFPKDSKDLIELVEMADSALYRAKHEGRNRVCSYRELSSEDAAKPLPPRSG